MALLGWLTLSPVVSQVALEKVTLVKNINTSLVRGDPPPAPLAVLDGRLIFRSRTPR